MNTLYLLPIRTVIGSRDSIRPIGRVCQGIFCFFGRCGALPPVRSVRLQVFAFSIRGEIPDVIRPIRVWALRRPARTNVPRSAPGRNEWRKCPDESPCGGLGLRTERTPESPASKEMQRIRSQLEWFLSGSLPFDKTRNAISDAPGKTYARGYTVQDAILIPEAPYIFPRNMTGVSPKGFPGKTVLFVRFIAVR